MPKLDYPKILTNKDWQSKKATLDKVGKGKKTGVGDALDGYQAAFAKTAFAKDSASLKLVTDTFDPLVLSAQFGPMRKNFMDERKKLESQMVHLDKKIDDTVKALGATNASAKHLVKVKAALRDFHTTGMAGHIHQVERALVAAYLVRLKKSSMAYSFVAANGEPGRRNVAPFGDQLASAKDMKDVDFYFNPGENTSNPPGRALSTLCQNWDQVMAAEFPEYSKKFFRGSAMEKAYKANKWLPQLATPKNVNIEAVAIMKDAVAKGADEAAVFGTFKREASASFKEAKKFLDAYFALIDTMPRDLEKL